MILIFDYDKTTNSACICSHVNKQSKMRKKKLVIEKEKNRRNEEKATNKRVCEWAQRSTVNTLAGSRENPIAMTMRVFERRKLWQFSMGIDWIEIEKLNKIYVRCHKIAHDKKSHIVSIYMDNGSTNTITTIQHVISNNCSFSASLFCTKH